jgi:twitching motility protein PilT
MAQIDQYLEFMVKKGCSDLHASAGQPMYVRLHGTLTPITSKPVQAAAIEKLIREILPERNLQEFEETNDTDFAYHLPGYARFRVNVFRDRFGMGGAFRQIPEHILTVEELGLPQAVVDFCNLPRGLILVTGPTGCGKTTTLATMIDYINQQRDEHIVTIEDPIEYVHESKKSLVHQREVFTHTQSFPRALRAALREDPDVVLVGEMRDLATMSIAIQTAETGHLVFATLHTTSAASSVDRLIDQFPPEEQEHVRQMVANSLKGVVTQTLLKRSDGKGRIAAMEVLVITSAISNLIREGKTYQIPSQMEVGRRYGMQNLNQNLLELVRAGVVDVEQAMLKAVDKSGFRTLLNERGIYLPGTAEYAARDEEATAPAWAASKPAPEEEPAARRRAPRDQAEEDLALSALYEDEQK